MTEWSGGIGSPRQQRAPDGGARVALYCRVSTRAQTNENQELELRRWAERLGLAVVRVYADTASGARSDRAARTARGIMTPSDDGLPEPTQGDLNPQKTDEPV